ncbi:Probable serine carboxypeptidase CPVL [Geodia barretti]|uniref:Probable serine carboxypeptidase CPVL n=1 Tax=Geodia barretti TaxID=519541 RepID=A0AA35SE91_GEOBA|nr:Probable serine carboxypeptidase CPVL [Geodia barretti]
MGRFQLNVCCLAILCLPLALCGPLGVQFRKHKAIYRESIPGTTTDSDPGQPLFLTPYIEKGEIDQARELSKVPTIQGLDSYSGFFTVNASSNGNMFFWFFPSQSGQTSAPLLLWLQGGPGGSSLFGLFVENGPLYVAKNGSVFRRDITWNKEYHMLYIDNPVSHCDNVFEPSRFLPYQISTLYKLSVDPDLQSQSQQLLYSVYI